MKTFLVLLLLLCAPASAAESLAVTILAQPTSPIQIVDCNARLLDTRVGNVDYYLAAAVAFKNTSTKTATAVEFGFSEFDVFGTFLGGTAGQVTGTYSTGAELDPRKNPFTNLPWPMWSWVNLYDSVNTVRCSVLKVLFDDGSQWSS